MRKLLVLGGALVASVLVLFVVGYVASGAPGGTVASITYERRGEELSVVEDGPADAPRATFARLEEFAGRTVELRGYMVPTGGLSRLEEFLLAGGKPTGGLEGLSSPERTVFVRLPEGRHVDFFRGVVRARGRLVPRDSEWQGRRVASWELLADVVLAEIPR